MAETITSRPEDRARFEPPHPRCSHKATGTIGWPGALDERDTEVGTHVCARPACQRDASAWVRAQTGHDGVYVTFDEARAHRRASETTPTGSSPP